MINSKKLITFILTHNCNFGCEYCNKKNIWDVENNIEAKDNVINSFIKFIKNSNEKFVIKFEDAEPLTHQRAIELIEAVLDNEHDLLLSTNFSYPIEIYEQIANFAKTSTLNLFISIHPKKLNLDEFYEKLERFDLITKNNNCVKYHLIAPKDDILQGYNNKINENLHKSIDFIDLNIKQKPVFFCEARDFYIENYYLNEIGIDKLQYDYKCKAGKISCVIDEHGNIYRCHREIEYGNLCRLNHICNVNKLNLLKKDEPCLCINCFRNNIKPPIQITTETMTYYQKYISYRNYENLQKNIKKCLIRIKRKIFGDRIFFKREKDKQKL